MWATKEERVAPSEKEVQKEVAESVLENVQLPQKLEREH